MALQTPVPPVEKLGTEGTERSNSVHGFNWHVICGYVFLALCTRSRVPSGPLWFHFDGRGTPQAWCDSPAVPILGVLISLVASFFIRRVAWSFQGHLRILARVDTNEGQRPGAPPTRHPHFHFARVNISRQLLTGETSASQSGQGWDVPGRVG